MTQVSRKGFVDKNGKQVVIVPNVSGATEGNLPQFDTEGKLQDSGISAELVGKEIHTLEYKDGSYESRMGVGKLNRDDDELDGAYIYGKDAIRLVVSGDRVFIDGGNIANLIRALATPSSTPENEATKLITSKAVFEALEKKSSLKSAMTSPKASIRMLEETIGNDTAGKIELSLTNAAGVKKTAVITQEKFDQFKALVEEDQEDLYPVAQSEKLIQSGAVWRALHGVQLHITEDNGSFTISDQTNAAIKQAFALPSNAFHFGMVGLFSGGVYQGTIPCSFVWLKDTVSSIKVTVCFANVMLVTTSTITDDNPLTADFRTAGWTRTQIGQNIFF